MDIKKITDFGFVKTHNIVKDASSAAPKFYPLQGVFNGQAPAVYVWVAKAVDSDKVEVLYVGKAGKGIDVRCNQHRGGFLYSSTGRKNAVALNDLIESGCEIYVYTRISGQISIFGENVSLYSTEEDAICKSLNPKLNRAIFPEVNIYNGNISGKISNMTDLIQNRLVQSSSVTTDDLFATIEEYDQYDKETTTRLLMFLEGKVLQSDHRSSLIKGYTKQPPCAENVPSCDGKTNLTFGHIGPSGRMRPKSWVARIYFTKPVRVGLPLELLKKIAKEKVTVNLQTKIFSPKDTNDFLNNNEDYIDSYIRNKISWP